MLWKIAQALVAISIAFAVARQQAQDALREGKAANRRLDEEEKLREDLALEFARFKAGLDTRMAVAEGEIRMLRTFRHDFPNQLTGKLGMIEHEVELLQDELHKGKA